MTGETATTISNEFGLFRFLLGQRVESRPLPCVGRRKLQNIAALIIADVNLIVEVQRPWLSRRNAMQLQTRLGKDQRLGTDGDVERLEHILQISVLRIKVQSCVALLKS